MFWGKVIGFFLGHLVAGPFGAVIGMIIGHIFDRGLNIQFRTLQYGVSGTQKEVQEVFFSETFSVMGHLAKADGRVTEREIQAAKNVMNRMQLSTAYRQEAIRLFNVGKEPGFNLQDHLSRLLKYCRSRQDLLHMFIEIQLQAGIADGQLNPIEHDILLQMCRTLGVSEYTFADMLRRNQAGQQYQHSAGREQKQRQYQSRTQQSDSLSQAYAVLGVQPSDSMSDIKKAYRRLMSQYHPDKLVSKGLPEEMMQVAKERTQQIRNAYEQICEGRGEK